MNHHKHRRSRTRSSSSGSSGSCYRKKRNRKHRRRRSRSGSTSSVSTVAPKKPDNQNTAWENIVIHYLSKLKNYWTSGYNAKPPSIRNSDVEVIPSIAPKDSGNLNISETPLGFEAENYCLAGKRKALNIVSNALEYGLANGIVSQNGNYFWIKDKLVAKGNISNPRMSPSKCGSCHYDSIKSKSIEKKTSAQAKKPNTALSKKSIKSNAGKKGGVGRKRKKIASAKVGKVPKKRARACSGFLNKCKCTKCKAIFKLL